MYISLVKPCQYEAITPAVDLSRLGGHIRNFLLGHGTRLVVNVIMYKYILSFLDQADFV